MDGLRYGSLFSGIGGIDLGMDMAGFECAWQVEVDEHCRRILEKHWPGVPKYKDIYDVKGSELEPVDILCGGFPCQPVSVAGQRAGVDDERWLWDEFYRLICEVRPRWVVAENVTGLLSANSGRAFAGVLRDLAEGGYDAVWDVFPAGGSGGVGAPHKRERIFIVATPLAVNRSRKPETLEKCLEFRKKIGRTSVPLYLEEVVKMWPTPTRSDHKGWSKGHKRAHDRSNRLDFAIEPQGGKGGTLNPMWVEWLMGFPIGWADLRCLETQSSPKSPTK